jgi:hypothetical protein
MGVMLSDFKFKNLYIYLYIYVDIDIDFLQRKKHVKHNCETDKTVM